MKSTGLIVLTSLFALGLSTYVGLEEPKVVPFGLVDQVVENMLSSLRTFLRELTFEDINETIVNPLANLEIVAENIELNGADLFNTAVLDTTLLPIEIRNLTLTWKEVSIETDYRINGTIDMDELTDTVNIDSEGKAKMTVYDVTATIGAKFDLIKGKIQVEPKGLFGFDVRIGKANVTLGPINGSEDIAVFLGAFLGNALPRFIDSVKEPLFAISEDLIIYYLNLYLRS